MRTMDLISDREFRDATAIHTIDPSHPDAAGHQLWGSKTVRSQVIRKTWILTSSKLPCRPTTTWPCCN
jgi:hypothetical protein